MHLGDSIFILILALVLLGPKKTAELAQQLGKLMNEFRKASNDFKYQFNEEMRVSEQREQQQKQDAERKTLDAGSAAEPENSILTPATSGLAADHAAEPAESVPYAISATTGDEHPLDDHPLLRVDVIPPMDGSPADQTAATAVTPAEGSAHGEPAAVGTERGEEHGA